MLSFCLTLLLVQFLFEGKSCVASMESISVRLYQVEAGKFSHQDIIHMKPLQILSEYTNHFLAIISQ